MYPYSRGLSRTSSRVANIVIVWPDRWRFLELYTLSVCISSIPAHFGGVVLCINSQYHPHVTFQVPLGTGSSTSNSLPTVTSTLYTLHFMYTCRPIWNSHPISLMFHLSRKIFQSSDNLVSAHHQVSGEILGPHSCSYFSDKVPPFRGPLRGCKPPLAVLSLGTKAGPSIIPGFTGGSPPLLFPDLTHQLYDDICPI